MRIPLLCLLSIYLLASCEKQQIKQEPFKKIYYYYTTDFDTVTLYLYLPEVYIEFKHQLSTEETQAFIDKYDFIEKKTSERILSGNKYLKCLVNVDDTIQLGNILKVLNQDTINFAVPVFTLINNNPKVYCIPLNGIVCDKLIPESELLAAALKYNLTLVKTTQIYYRLEINYISTGFEPLEIANSLYETGKFKFCYPSTRSAYELIK
jgi:hypothetical protein